MAVSPSSVFRTHRSLSLRPGRGQRKAVPIALLRPAVSGSPAYLHIADALRLLIVDGRIPVGSRIPSERDLTLALGLSRTTTTRSYAELRDRGYITSRRGSGSLAALPGEASHRLAGPLTPGDSEEGKLDLTVAALSAPPGTAAAFASAIDYLPGYLSGSGYHPLGLEVLRTAIALRFNERGVPTKPDQIIVTSGALSEIRVDWSERVAQSSQASVRTFLARPVASRGRRSKAGRRTSARPKAGGPNRPTDAQSRTLRP